MDGSRFDNLTRAVTRSRRSIVWALIGSATWGLPFVDLAVTKGKGGKKKHNKHPKPKPKPPCRDRGGKPCDGCCKGNVCVRKADSRVTSACGIGGRDCEECNPGVRCDQDRRICVCDQESCFGCCSQPKDGFFKRCRTGQDDDACQDGRPVGDPCVDCTKKSPAETCSSSAHLCELTCTVTRHGARSENPGIRCGDEGLCCATSEHCCGGTSCCASNEQCCLDHCCPAGTDCKDELSSECCPLGGKICEGECCTYPDCCFINPCETGPINVCLSPGDGLGGTCGPNGPVGITYDTAVHGETCRCGRGVWQECPG